jgi:DNA repair exonuclease SbcCD ATPase subunit
MKISFQRLTLANFKDHQNVMIKFGDLTSLSGKNGSGKSSIGESVSWLFFGVDLAGASKFDPTPTNREVEIVSNELLMTVDEQELLLKRELVKGKAKYYINEVPETATKFNDLVKEIFRNKELFLAIFNPVFFCSQKWEEQRKQLLQYVSEPTNAEVLKSMYEVDAKTLEPLLKKHTLDDLEKIHRDTFNKKDKELDAAQSRVKTLQEQLDEATNKSEGLDLNLIIQQIKKRQEVIKNYQSLLDEHNLAQKKKDALLHDFNIKTERFKADFEHYKAMGSTEHDTTCELCGSDLNEYQIEKIVQGHQKSLADKKAKLLEQKEAALAIKNQYNTFIVPPAPQNPAEISEEINRLIEQQSLAESKFKLFDMWEKSKADAEKIRKERNESQGIVDNIKTFRAKRAELMAAKIKEVFITLDIRLTTMQKNGEEKIDFVVEHGGVAYRDLSKAEQIRAGLEISDVFMRQADLITPVFVDNGESIDDNGFPQPLGQLILARVANTAFAVQTKSFEKVSETNE